MRKAAALVCLALLAACAPVQHPAPGGPTFEDAEVRVAAPTGWILQPSTSDSDGTSQVRLYLANQPLRPDCDAQLLCQSPLANGLRPGGMFVKWITARCVAQACDLPAAQLIAVGNRQGVRVPATAACEGIGTTDGS